MTRYDVVIVGAGPAGSTCAAFCAEAGLKTLVLEKSRFPREKVCGDCINPGCWPILDRLDAAEEILALPHSKLEMVDFVGINGFRLRCELDGAGRGEIAVKRSLFDQTLLESAVEHGAEVYQEMPVEKVTRGWRIEAGGENFEAPILVAADGRNSSVARLVGILPAPRKERVALQTHLSAPPQFGQRVVLRLLRNGYCGYSSVGDDKINLCLVSKPRSIAWMKRWATQHFSLSGEETWRTITPLSRAEPMSVRDGLFLIGDVARVVEPFTGEGIYYAMASGEIAARCIIAGRSSRVHQNENAKLYVGRLWVNRIAKFAALHPGAGTILLQAMRCYPRSLRFLTAKVTGSSARKIAPHALI